MTTATTAPAESAPTPPVHRRTSPGVWVKKNLFSNWYNSLLTIDQPTYPARLRELADPPSALFLHGDPELLGREAQGVVVAAMTLPNVLDHLREGSVVITPGQGFRVAERDHPISIIVMNVPLPEILVFEPLLHWVAENLLCLIADKGKTKICQVQFPDYPVNRIDQFLETGPAFTDREFALLDCGNHLPETAAEVFELCIADDRQDLFVVALSNGRHSISQD